MCAAQRECVVQFYNSKQFPRRKRERLETIYHFVSHPRRSLIFAYNSKAAIATEVFIRWLYGHMLAGRKVSRSLLYRNTAETIGSDSNGAASSFPSFLPYIYIGSELHKHGSHKVFTASEVRSARLVSKHPSVLLVPQFDGNFAVYTAPSPFHYRM